MPKKRIECFSATPWSFGIFRYVSFIHSSGFLKLLVSYSRLVIGPECPKKWQADGWLEQKSCLLSNNLLQIFTVFTSWEIQMKQGLVWRDLSTKASINYSSPSQKSTCRIKPQACACQASNVNGVKEAVDLSVCIWRVKCHSLACSTSWLQSETVVTPLFLLLEFWNDYFLSF